MIVLQSASLMIPQDFNIRACAREPAMSYSASRRSKCSEAVKASTVVSVLPLKRPPQSLSVAIVVSGAAT